MAGTSWTIAREERLAQLWGSHSAQEIAGSLGGFEHMKDGGRSAVIGKAHRMKLPSKGNRCADPEELDRRQQKRRQSNNEKQRVRNMHRRNREGGGNQMDAVPESTQTEPPPYLGLAPLVPFNDLEPNECRFIENESAPFMACGNLTAPGASFCGHHHRIVYRKQGAERELSDEERSRRAGHMRRVAQPGTVAGDAIARDAA